MKRVHIIKKDDYKIKKKIGSGAYGFINLVEEKKTGKLYAMKSVYQNRKTKSKEALQNEINFYLKIDHPTISKFYGYNISDSKIAMFLLEYMPNGSLYDALSQMRKKNISLNFTGTKKYIILLGIAHGMNYLHSRSIIHRDLKSSNILLDENFYPKICDFGISFESNKPCYNIRMNDHVGTPLYESPEIFKMKPYSYKTDIYSFSLIAYELITGKNPYRGCSLNQIKENVIQGIRNDISDLPSDIREIFEKCWSDDELRRPTFFNIISMIEKSSLMEYLKVDIDEVIQYKKQFVDNSTLDYFLSLHDIDDKKILKYSFLEMYLIGAIMNNKNRNEGIKYIKMAADNGVTIAMLNYVNILTENDYEKNKDEIRKYLKNAAYNGDIDGMFKYAEFLRTNNSDDNEENKKEMIKFYKLAADKGHIKSTCTYSFILLIKENDVKNSIKYIKKAADLGNVEFMLIYGLFYLTGEYVEKNSKEAAKYLKKAANLYNSEALYFYGKMLIDGDGIPADVDEGIIYLKRSADQGYVESMVLLSNVLLYPEEYRINKKEATEYLKMTTEQRIKKSNERLLNLLLSSETRRKNKKEAAKYLKMAANQGHGGSAYKYAEMCYYGIGIQIDINEALKYFKIGGDKGCKMSMFCYSIICIFNLHRENDKEKIFEEKRKGFKSIKKLIDLEFNQAISFFLFYIALNNYSKINPKFLLFNTFNVIPMKQKDLSKYMQKALNHVEIKCDEGDEYFLSFYLSFLNPTFGFPKDTAKEMKYLNKLVSIENKQAMKELGLKLLNGLDVEKDIYKSFELFKKLGDGETYSCIFDKMLFDEEIFKKLKSKDYITEKDMKYFISIEEKHPYKISKKEKKECLYDNIKILFLYNGFLLFTLKIFSEGIYWRYYEACDGLYDLYYLISVNARINDQTSYKLYMTSIFGLTDSDNPECYFYLANFLKYSAAKGNINALVKYGELLYNGNIVKADKEKAVKIFKIAADCGEEQAMFYYGKHCYENDIDGTNFDEYLSYIKNSADLGCFDAMLLMAEIILQGKIPNLDKTEAVKYLEKTIECNDPKSMLYYGNMLLEGNLIKKDKIKGIDFIKKSADLGNTEASLKYGKILYEGIEIPQNKKQAAVYFKKAVDQGNEEAILQYGLMLLRGDGIESNKNEAYFYLKMIADQGNSIAMYEYGKHLISTFKENTFEEGVNYIKQSADLGYVDSIHSYGFLLRYGIGVQMNVKESDKYFKKSIELKSTYGMWLYAECLLNSEDIESKKEAIKYIKILIEHNNKEAMLMYAKLLFIGKVIPMNLKEAAYYFKKSADLGCSEAMSLYASMLYNGQGIQINENESFKYFKKAIELDDIFGLYKYSEILIESRVAEKQKEAIKYIRRIISKGNAFEFIENSTIYDIFSKDPYGIYSKTLALYGKMLYYGLLVPKDKVKAIEYLKKSIELNNNDSIYLYAKILFKNDDDESINKAVEYLILLISRGYKKAEKFDIKVNLIKI